MENSEVLLSSEKEQKILNKIYSIGLTKIAIGKSPFISIPEFKSIISEQQICRKMWFKLAKDFEEKGYVFRRARRCLFVRLSIASLVGVYNYKDNLRRFSRKLISPSKQHHRQ